MKHKIYLEILDRKRQEVFKRLREIFQDRCYLAGGTALALQINHRQSLDFDLFQAKPVTLQDKQKLIKGLAGHRLQTLVDTADELTLALDQQIKVTLLNYFWPPLFPLVRAPKMIPLLSIKDLAANKAYALGRRGNFRDYFDLYIIVKTRRASLKQIVSWSKKKYGEIFSERMFLEQLVYARDIAKEENLLFLMESSVTPSQIAAFFAGKINKLK